MPVVAQELLILRFDPPAELERALVDPRVPRTGPAVLLFADAVDLDQRAAAPLEPQRSAWTEVALGYATRCAGEPATAFPYPWLWLQAARSDPAGPVADVALTGFHPACPGADGPARGRRLRADARTYRGDAIASLEVELRAEAEVPDGLFLWVNRLRWPDLASGGDLDGPVVVVRAEALELASCWAGAGTALLGPGAPTELRVDGDALWLGARFALRGATPYPGPAP